jgi:23S rRNA pseudouridine2605 synthase
VNGVVRRDPETPVSLEFDRLSVDGKSVNKSLKTYWMVNKPRGIVTTMSDEKGRACVSDLLPSSPWVGPVGRLDKASEGLLLLTNDSQWGARITDPESHVVKTYHVQIAAHVDDGTLRVLTQGVRVGDSLWRVKRVLVLRTGDKNTWLEIQLDEGRNRQIRRIFDALHIEVLRLVRVAIGSLQLGNLPKGKIRSLTPREIRELRG